MSMKYCSYSLSRLAGMHAVDFKFNAGNPLEVDAVLVDEASMVDVKMGLALLEALPKGCRLVLVGESPAHMGRQPCLLM